MALTKYQLITKYMISRGLISLPEAAQVWSECFNIIDEAIVYHAKYKQWEFRRGSDTVVTDSNDYVESNELESISQVAFEGVGKLEKISQKEYRDRTINITSGVNYPDSVWIDGSRAYPCPKPVSGKSVVLMGEVNTQSAINVLNAIDVTHEPMIMALIDFYRMLKPLGFYQDMAGSFFLRESTGKADELDGKTIWQNIEDSIGT